MQDILLEPYGGKILHLPVGVTTALTAMLALGGGAGLTLAARRLSRGARRPSGRRPRRARRHRRLRLRHLLGAVRRSGPCSASASLLIGFGGGLFAHGTLTASMALAKPEDRGLALGAWGASQATAAGLAIGFSGVVNDLVSSLAIRGAFGEALADPVTGYGFVYSIEIVLLFATLVAIGPLVRSHGDARRGEPSGFTAAYPAGLKSGGL